MWRDKFNLGPDRDDSDESTPATPEQDNKEEEQDHDGPKTVYTREEYGALAEQLFQVNLFMTAIKESGEENPVRIPITVPDFNMGALCEILHWNGIPYNCKPIPPEETGEEEDEED